MRNINLTQILVLRNWDVSFFFYTIMVMTLRIVAAPHPSTFRAQWGDWIGEIQPSLLWRRFFCRHRNSTGISNHISDIAEAVRLIASLVTGDYKMKYARIVFCCRLNGTFFTLIYLDSTEIYKVDLTKQKNFFTADCFAPVLSRRW